MSIWHILFQVLKKAKVVPSFVGPERGHHPQKNGTKSGKISIRFGSCKVAEIPFSHCKTHDGNANYGNYNQACEDVVDFLALLNTK